MDGSAQFVDCSVRSSVRKNPGLTMVVAMPNGANLAVRRPANDAEAGERLT